MLVNKCNQYYNEVKLQFSGTTPAREYMDRFRAMDKDMTFCQPIVHCDETYYAIFHVSPKDTQSALDFYVKEYAAQESAIILQLLA